MEDFIKPYRRYAQFEGRSDRKEFWYYVIFYVVVSCILSALDGLLFGGHYTIVSDQGWQVTYDRDVLAGLFNLVSLIPWIALQVRRLHDTNKSGWLVLFWWIPIIGWLLLLIWYCEKGDAASNAHGEAPEGSRIPASL